MLKIKTSRTITRYTAETKHQPEMRLFCFHNAGGSASFFTSWATALPPEIEVCAVQLPGREDRRGEAPLERIEEVLDLLVQELRPYVRELPFAFFGHNMGALVAYELTHRLRSEQLPGPEHLFVSGLSAPQLGQPFGPLEALSDNELVATITRIGGIPQGILRRPSFLELILPVLRADFRLCSDYRYARPLRQLSCPVTALGGAGDPMVSGWQLQAWDKQTSGRFELRMYPGGHCFLRTARARVLAVIQDALGAPEALRRAS